MLLEQLVEGDPEAGRLGVRIAGDLVGELGHDGARERVADHLHVGVGRADARIGLGPVLGGLGVDDVLGLEHVVGDERGDRVERQARGIRDELREVGHVLGGQVGDRLVLLCLVLGRDARGVVHEVAVVGAPDGVERSSASLP